jgi:DNA-binding NarL/FixJ family response regulator
LTRIILMLNTKNEAMLVFDDPREPRELVKAINTGAWQPVGSADAGLDSSPTALAPVERAHPTAARSSAIRHWAVSHDLLDIVTVVQEPPPVALTPRHYDVLFGLADGQPAKEIAGQLHISRRTVYLYISELKERLGANSRAHLVALAISNGLLCKASFPFY